MVFVGNHGFPPGTMVQVFVVCPHVCPPLSVFWTDAGVPLRSGMADSDMLVLRHRPED